MAHIQSGAEPIKAPMKGKDESSNRSASSNMMFFLYAVCAIEGADSQLLPASFRSLEVNLGLTPSSLALLALGQALAQFICTPIWGGLADSGYSRKRLLSIGAFSWGILTLLLALVSNYQVMFLLRVLNGVALGSLGPISQSLIVDYSASHERGTYFGGVQFASNVGNILCAVGTSSISMRMYGSVQGWRLAFCLVANVSIMLAFAIFTCMPEPLRRGGDTVPSLSGELSKVMRYLRIRTFCVLVAQGMFGSIPWSAMGFMIMYFQYMGMSDFHAPFLFSFVMMGGAFGGIVGGVVGDSLARWSPMHGRALCAEISVAAGIPLVVAILTGSPHAEGAFPSYCLLVFVFGMMASWCPAGVNRPILSEIVEERDRASVFAWLVTIDGSFAAVFGGPMVGILSERVFGYHPSQDSIATMSEAHRLANATALCNALMWCCVVPWLICLACYGFLHITYKQDVDKLSLERDGARATTSLLTN